MEHLLTRLPLLVAISTALIVGTLPQSVAARQAPRLLAGVSDVVQAAPTSGDLTWSFSRRNIFADERVVTAFAIFVDEPAVVAAAGVGVVQLGYADSAVSVAAEGQSAELAEMLLAASGIASSDAGPNFVQSRRCRIWTPPEAASTDADAVAGALSAALVTAFSTIGIAIDRCDAASTAAAADIFLSTVEVVVEDPSLFVTDAESFLVFRGGLIDPGNEGTGGEPVPAVGGPLPGAGGSAGLATSEGNALAVTLVLTALTALAVFAGRRATRPHED